MLLNKKFQRLTNTVFDAVTGLTKSAKFHRYTGGAYVASSGGFSGSSFESSNIKVIINDYRHTEIDNEQVLVTDKRVLLPASSLPGKVPTANDKVEIDNKLWTIVSSAQDTTESVYILQIRQ